MGCCGVLGCYGDALVLVHVACFVSGRACACACAGVFVVKDGSCGSAGTKWSSLTIERAEKVEQWPKLTSAVLCRLQARCCADSKPESRNRASVMR